MDESVGSLQNKLALLSAPIAGDSAVGVNAFYDSEFEAVKSEIDKLKSLQSGAPDWSQIVKNSEQLLTNRTKDFRLLIWLSLARLHIGGFLGLIEGIQATKVLCERYWDKMYPPLQPQFRASSIGWLYEQIVAKLNPFEPTATDADALKSLQGSLQELDQLLASKLPKEAYSELGQNNPAMGQLDSALRNTIRKLPVTEAAASTPSPGAASAPVPSHLATAAIAVPEVQTINGVGEAVSVLRNLGQAILEVSRQLRRADPAHLVAYRLQRTGIWLAVLDTPRAEAGKTRLPPPAAEIRKKLEAQVQAAQWMELLSTAEDLTRNHLFWFDLHRYVALAMDHLGALFVEARKVVGSEVVTFLDRMPAVTKLQFADGSPFADLATQNWIDEERAKHNGGGKEGTVLSRVSQEDEDLARRFEEAREMVVSGNAADGLALATQLAARGADARNRFRSRLSVAQIALKGGQIQVGRPILESLLAEADAKQLDEWEPELAASVYSALLVCERSAGGHTKRPEYQRVFEKLCRIDPASALRLNDV